jgi:Concanavalin A-like lectin/glucanases superfamily
MCQEILCQHGDGEPGPSSQSSNGPNRRAFLRNTGLAGAGLAGATVLGAARTSPAAAATVERQAASSGAGAWNPNPNSSRFTLAVMPDTQFLYWGSQGSVNPAPQEESFRYVIANSSSEQNIVFMAHLGDLTEDAEASSFGYVNGAFDILDKQKVAYSVLAGNHDVSGYDNRGTTPYLQTMGPQRFKKSATFAGADSSGYNTAHIFQAGRREWLLLAMDWRTSNDGFAWANQFIADHPELPVIVTTHEIIGSTYNDNVLPYVAGDPENDAALSDYGQTVWENLINENDRIFLTLNGHYWPPGRMTTQNDAGHDVSMHITNYQNRYFGGGAMLRLYHFDLSRNTIDVETLSPWALAQPEERNVLAAQEARLTTTVDRFAVPIDFETRLPVPAKTIGLGAAGARAKTARPPSSVLVPGTLAYWRFDNGGANGTPVTPGTTIPDLSGNGNDLSNLVTVPNSPPNVLTWSSDYAPSQPGHGSLYFNGAQNGEYPLQGAYFTTGAKAPLNTETFPKGFTFEVYVNIPLDWSSDDNAWMAVLSRWGESGQAGKTGGDPKEPIMTFSFSGDREPQWNVYPPSLNSPTTNWGQGLPEQTWWHLAVVNDGKHSTLYIEGCPTVDNAQLVQSTGITQLALPWALGGYEYGGVINQIFHGWVGDVRIVDRPLPVKDFMLYR